MKSISLSKVVLCMSLCSLFFSVSVRGAVITKRYDWEKSEAANFDIYYYGSAGKNLLPYTSAYLANARKRAQRVFPKAPAKAPFFLYNSHNDFEETNIVDIGEGTGGVTEAFKNRFLVGHMGSQRYLEYVISHEYIHEIEFEYFFTGFWRSARLVKIILYPIFIMEGLSEYCSGDLDSTTREMYLRDAAVSGRLFKIQQLYNFSHVMPHQVTLAYKESEAFMRFLAQEYGEDKLAKILESYKDKYDPDSVFYDVIGTSLGKLDKKFQEYMSYKYKTAAKGLEEPESYGTKITRDGPYPRFFEGGVLSPDGGRLAYISDERGRKEIYIYDMASKKKSRLISLACSIKIENIHSDGFPLSFSQSGRYLAFSAERLQRDNIYIYDFKSRELKEFGPGTESVSSPVFSKDEKKVYFAGLKEGFKNIFEYELGSGNLEALTNGAYDKTDLSLSPDGARLVFAAERRSAASRSEYDLAQVDIASKNFGWLTAYPGDERWPSFAPDGTIYFTSDTDGISDIYMLNDSGSRQRITRVLGGNFCASVSKDGSKLVFSSFRNGSKHIYVMSLPASPLPGEVIPAASDTVSPLAPVSADSASPLQPRCFRAPFSTDLFFPMLFYSSVDGLYLAMYYQGSDFLGNHQVQAMSSYAGGPEYLDYQAAYGFLKYRPKFYITVSGNEYFEDSLMKVKKRNNLQSLSLSYPLNRYESVGIGASTIERLGYYSEQPWSNFRLRDNSISVQYSRDNAAGPYMEATTGSRLLLRADFSDKYWESDYTYQSFVAEGQAFLPLFGENVLAARMFLGESFGPSAGYFKLGGFDRVRGYSSDLSDGYIGKKIIFSNVEWRFPIFYNINYHMWYFLPDFYFKTMYGAVFADSGLAWNDDYELQKITNEQARGSYGVSLRVHTFILQTFPLLLNFQLARRFEGPHYVFYFATGTNF